MLKKRRGSRLMPGQEGEVIRVKPFLLDGDCAQNESSQQNTKQNNMQMENENSDKLSPQLKKRVSKSGIMTTPTKKPVRNAELEGAAKKECPFRDLEPRRSLF